MIQTRNVSLRDVLAEIEEEVRAYVPHEDELKPVAGEPGDQVVGVVELPEVMKLFALKNKYDLRTKTIGLYYTHTGGKFPEGVTEADAIRAQERAEAYEGLFWGLVRRLTDQWGVALAIREGWVVVIPDVAKLRAERGLPPQPQVPQRKELVN